MTKFALAVVAAVALTSIFPVASFGAVVIDRVPHGSNTSTIQCGSELGYLKRVYPTQIAGIDQATQVWVTEVCSDTSMVRSEGNADYLRPTIAKNKVLNAALLSKSFSAEDVFAVRMMGEGTINLYVHRFDR